MLDRFALYISENHYLLAIGIIASFIAGCVYFIKLLKWLCTIIPKILKFGILNINDVIVELSNEIDESARDSIIFISILVNKILFVIYLLLFCVSILIMKIAIKKSMYHNEYELEFLRILYFSMGIYFGLSFYFVGFFVRQVRRKRKSIILNESADTRRID